MSVFVADEQSEAVDVGWIRHLATLVLEAEDCPPDSEVSVILVGDEQMAGYNRRFLAREGATDVISLPIEHLVPGAPPPSLPTGPPPLLGDVLLDPAYIRRQAADRERDFEDEMAMFVVHGLLHLLGYEHDTDQDAERMEERERRLLALAGRSRR